MMRLRRGLLLSGQAGMMAMMSKKTSQPDPPDDTKNTDGDDNDNGNIIRMPSQDKWRKHPEPENAQAVPPMINLPPVTKILLALILIPHIGITLFADPVTTYHIYMQFGFVPAYYSGATAFPGIFALTAPLSYVFLHGSWLHVGMNALMLLAFGSGVGRWMGGRRYTVLFAGCSLLAVATHFALAPFSLNPVIGASGGISGLFAAALVMLYRQGYLGAGRYGILPFALLWIVISAIFGFTGGPDGSAIAWSAHIGGFLAGFILLKPIMNKMRKV